ncbi:Uncharacterised protein [uncultured archaeon]|nr:Uncharacterised protein [uncultured archaeon]
METVEEVQEEITEEAVRLWHYFGQDETPARIYMAIFFADEPIGLKEISEKTGYSMSLISTHMDVVERLYDVRRFKKAGSKKIFFTCIHNAQETMEKRMRELDRTLENMLASIEKAEKQLDGKDPAAQSTLRHIKKLKNDYECFRKAFKKHNARP